MRWAFCNALRDGGLRSAVGTMGFLSIFVVVIGCQGGTPGLADSSDSSSVDSTLCAPVCDGATCGNDACGGTCACGGGLKCDADKLCVPTQDSTDPTCAPKCDGTRCEDGCGGPCECAEGTLCNAKGDCVISCTDSCETAGAQCGEVCKVDCGTCGPHESCVDHKCMCEPKCDGTRCDDGCGGLCECAQGTVCNADDQCVDPKGCVDTCSGAGRQCGEICGAACGECDENEACTDRRCRCEPKCDGTSCDDGCGGVCECGAGLVCNAGRDCVEPGQCADTCAEASYGCGALCGVACGVCGDSESCAFGTCKSELSSLMLRLEEVTASGGRTQALLAIEFQPSQGQALPRLADLRLEMRGASDLQVESVAPGQAVEAAGKELFVDTLTGKPWQVLPDGAVELLVYSSRNSEEIGAGRWLAMTVSFVASGTTHVWLTRREHIFAPLAADLAIENQTYDLPVMVTP